MHKVTKKEWQGAAAPSAEQKSISFGQLLKEQ